MNTAPALLTVNGLSTEIATRSGVLRTASGITFRIHRGETVGFVGESGSGKTMLGLTLLGLLPKQGRVTAGEVLLDGVDILKCSEREWRRIRGSRISMILQDPMRSLNPVMTVGSQVAEPLRRHQQVRGRAVVEAVVSLFESLRIPAAQSRVGNYPHQMSGGMRQRVMGAVALSCRPDLLIADEPTTSLDVTVQAQYLVLLRQLQLEHGLSILYISHDLATVAQLCHRVAVMYAGRIVEILPVRRLARTAVHPYTRALIDCSPGEAPHKSRLRTIEGQPPDLRAESRGCAFAARCPRVLPRCREEEPASTPIDADHSVACWVARK